jgi:hypothetical protein
MQDQTKFIRGSQDPFDILGILDALEGTETATERYLKIEFVWEMGWTKIFTIMVNGHAGVNFMHMDSQDPFDILGMQDTLESTETATERYLKMEFMVTQD